MCFVVCLNAWLCENRLKLVYATVQLFFPLGYIKRRVAQDGSVQGREGRPKARGDGIVVGLDKARHVKMVGKGGGLLLGGRENVASHHGKKESS